MHTLSNLLKVVDFKQAIRKSHTFNSVISSRIRSYSDTPKTDVKSPKELKIRKVQGTENEERMRVRRARPSDVPRVLRFVREHARITWPGLGAPPASPQLMLCDYVARALAQGHSMLAEQQEIRRGWTQIRGLALGSVVCPWDASMMEKWARCLRCTRSKRMMQFQAHCLRAPALHDKYRVHNILQVILIVPQDSPKSAEIVNILAKNSIKRGREVGFQLIRFDVTNDNMAKHLDDLHLKKEWQLTYDMFPETVKDTEDSPLPGNPNEKEAPKSEYEKKPAAEKGYIAVFTVNPSEKAIT